MLKISSILLLILILIGIGLIYSFLKSKEIANTAAQSACENHQLQFLDGTTSFAKIRFKRNHEGRLRIQHYYRFEYFDGESRKTGTILVSDLAVQQINFTHEKQHASTSNVIQFPNKKDNTQ